MMENRSFDHYLGWLPGADGRQAGLRFTDKQGHVHETHWLGNLYQSCGFLDPDHSWQGGRTELDGGRMDGFLKADSDVFSIGYYTETGPAVHAPRREGVHRLRPFLLLALVLDLPQPRVHARRPSPTGRSTTRCRSPRSGQLGFPDTTIFASLARRGRLQPLLLHRHPGLGAVGRRRASRARARCRRSTSRLRRARCRRCPSSIPSFNGEDQGTSGDEHPLADIRVGQAFIADVVHAFMESPQWKRGALFIVYDEWGGFFDHVVPPRVPDLRASTDLNEDFGQMGFRIPAVLVSPYARRGYVDHSIYGFESILKMIRYRYGLAAADAARSVREQHRGYAFDWESTPTSSRPSCRRRHT